MTEHKPISLIGVCLSSGAIKPDSRWSYKMKNQTNIMSDVNEIRATERQLSQDWSPVDNAILDAIVTFPVNLNLFERQGVTTTKVEFGFDKETDMMTVPENLTRDMVIKAIRNQYQANMLYSKRSDNYELIYRYCSATRMEEKSLIYEALKNQETDNIKKFHNAYRNWKTLNITAKKENEQKKAEKKAAMQLKNYNDAIALVRDNFADFVNNPAVTDDNIIAFHITLSHRVNAIRKARASAQGSKQ